MTNDTNKHISSYLKTSNFYCQQLIVPHLSISTIVMELEEYKRRFPTQFENLNIVLDFSEILLEHNVSFTEAPEFPSELKYAIEALGHKVVGAMGIKATLAKQHGLKHIKPKTQSNSLKLSQNAVDNEEKKIETTKSVQQNITSTIEDEKKNLPIETMIIEGSVRSGTEIYAEGKNLLIVGDVKRGAEIAAGYSITVFGKLCGRAHAGVNKSKTSTITAMTFDPELVSINGTFLGNQDIESDTLGQSALVILKPEQNKLLIRKLENRRVQ